MSCPRSTFSVDCWTTTTDDTLGGPAGPARTDVVGAPAALVVAVASTWAGVVPVVDALKSYVLWVPASTESELVTSTTGTTTTGGTGGTFGGVGGTLFDVDVDVAVVVVVVVGPVSPGGGPLVVSEPGSTVFLVGSEARVGARESVVSVPSAPNTPGSTYSSPADVATAALAWTVAPELSGPGEVPCPSAVLSVESLSSMATCAIVAAGWCNNTAAPWSTPPASPLSTAVPVPSCRRNRAAAASQRQEPSSHLLSVSCLL